MKFVLACLTAVALTGCTPPSEPAKPANLPVASKQPVTPPAAGGGSGGGIAPMGTPAVGGLTPVANSDSVEGAGGGGVGQAAKNQARRVAAGGAGGDANSTGATTGE